MTRSNLGLAMSAVLAALCLSACSGSSGGDSGAGGTTASVTQWCATYRAAQEKDNLINSASDPTTARALANDAGTATQKAVDEAPADIRPDMTTVAQVLDDSLDAWQRRHFAPAAIADPRSLVDPGELGRGVAAGQRLASYVASRC
jgi:hypothetical protein